MLESRHLLSPWWPRHWKMEMACCQSPYCQIFKTSAAICMSHACNHDLEDVSLSCAFVQQILIKVLQTKTLHPGGYKFEAENGLLPLAVFPC